MLGHTGVTLTCQGHLRASRPVTADFQQERDRGCTPFRAGWTLPVELSLPGGLTGCPDTDNPRMSLPLTSNILKTPASTSSHLASSLSPSGDTPPDPQPPLPQ